MRRAVMVMMTVMEEHLISWGVGRGWWALCIQAISIQTTSQSDSGSSENMQTSDDGEAGEKVGQLRRGSMLWNGIREQLPARSSPGPLSQTAATLTPGRRIDFRRGDGRLRELVSLAAEGEVRRCTRAPITSHAKGGGDGGASLLYPGLFKVRQKQAWRFWGCVQPTCPAASARAEPRQLSPTQSRKILRCGSPWGWNEGVSAALQNNDVHAASREMRLLHLLHLPRSPTVCADKCCRCRCSGGAAHILPALSQARRELLVVIMPDPWRWELGWRKMLPIPLAKGFPQGRITSRR